jgi:hypothetical protein
MLRTPTRVLLLVALLAALLESTTRGQPAATSDRVYYRDKKDGQVKDLPAELKASPAGYQVIAASDKKVVATVSAADIVRVVPADIPGYDYKAIMEPVNFEVKKEWDKARTGHAEMLKKSSGAPEKVRKYLEFRVAICAAHSADETTDEAAAQAKTDEAVKLLENFLTAYKTGWEVWPAAQTCARLQITSSDRVKNGDKESERRMFDAASRTWGKLARAADLAPDLKLDATLQEIDCKIRARQPADAKAIIDESMKSAPAGAVKERLNVYQLAVKFLDNPNPADGVAAIEADIAKTKDASVRAAAYGVLGELYLNADKPRDAMWQYLWVEVVYSHDRDEVIKALVRLSDSFRMQGDDDRAKAYQEKARRLRAGP